MKHLVSTLKNIFSEFSKDRVSQLSGAFSYGAVFSLAPLILVLISIIGFIYGEKAAQGKLISELSGTVGASTAKTIQSAVAHAHSSKTGVVALVIGGVGSLLGATGLTSTLQNSFNLILKVVPDPKAGIKRTVYVKVKNVFLVLLAAIFVTASLVASAIIVGFSSKLTQRLGISSLAVQILNSLISLLVFILILYLIYLTLPDVKIPKKMALITSAYVSLLFLIGKIALGIIIGRNSTASAYGAAASLISLLLWLYYSAEILFLGAEGIKVYAEEHSIQMQPKKFNIKRTTITLDAPGLTGKLAEAWTRGFNKGTRK
jgi:membrane protein